MTDPNLDTLPADCLSRRHFLTGAAGLGLVCAAGGVGGLLLAPDTLLAGSLSPDGQQPTTGPTTGTVIKTVSRYKQRPVVAPSIADYAPQPGVQTYRFSAQEPDLNIPSAVLSPTMRTASIGAQNHSVAGHSSGIQPGFRMGAPQQRPSQVVVNLPKTRGIWAYNANVSEHVKLSYVRDGYYDPGALTAIDWLLRDHHFSRYVPMSRRLYDVLYVTQYRYGFNKPLVITSGYRTPRTNQLLAERVPGVGRRSYHLRGQAVDFHVPGVPLRELANFLLALGVGGVGLYPRHVHVDVGPLRSWA